MVGNGTKEDGEGGGNCCNFPHLKLEIQTNDSPWYVQIQNQ